MSSPSNVNLNDLQPPAKPDSFNVEWQEDLPVPDPNSPGNYVANVSACYRTPPVGGVFVLTADYDVSETDSGLILIGNSSSAIIFTLPSVAPVLKAGQGIWQVRIKNLGTGDLNVDPNGLTIDGSAVTLVLPQNSGFDVSTDGTNYWTYGNFGSGGGSTSVPIAALFSDDETPSGTINGSNTAFTLASAPNPAGSLELYQNGMLLIAGTDYTLSTASITMTAAPGTGDSLRAYYRYGSGSTSNFADDETPGGTINSSNTAFTLANAPNPASSLELYLDGLMLKAGVDYALSGLSITMTTAPATGDSLLAYYRFVAATALNFSGEETPSGLVNSSNTAFVLAHSVSPAASLRLYRNGILQKAGGTDFTLSGSSITFVTAPTTGDLLYAFYRY